MENEKIKLFEEIYQTCNQKLKEDLDDDYCKNWLEKHRKEDLKKGRYKVEWGNGEWDWEEYFNDIEDAKEALNDALNGDYDDEDCFASGTIIDNLTGKEVK